MAVHTRSMHSEDQCCATQLETLTSFAPIWNELPGNIVLEWKSPIALSFYTPVLKQGRGKGLVEGIILLGSIYGNKILAIFQSWGSYRRKK